MAEVSRKFKIPKRILGKIPLEYEYIEVDGKVLHRKIGGFKWFIHKSIDENWYEFSISELETGFKGGSGYNKENCVIDLKTTLMRIGITKFSNSITETKEKYGAINSSNK